jgi:hypothetical protein
MHQTITLLSIFLLYFKSGFSQHATAFAGDLLQLEERYFKAYSSEEKSTIALQKMNLYIREHAETDEQILDECKRVRINELEPEVQHTFLWNAALIYYIHQNYTRSSELLRQYIDTTHDTSTAAQLLYVLAANASPYDSIETSFLNGHILDIQTCLKNEKDNQHPSQRLNWVSYILPGGGMALKGYPKQASAAFVLNAGSGFVIYTLWQHALYANAIGYALLTAIKFYPGNITYTKKLIRKRTLRQLTKDAKNCHSKLEDLLTQFPIDFKKDSLLQMD